MPAYIFLCVHICLPISVYVFTCLSMSVYLCLNVFLRNPRKASLWKVTYHPKSFASNMHVLQTQTMFTVYCQKIIAHSLIPLNDTFHNPYKDYNQEFHLLFGSKDNYSNRTGTLSAKSLVIPKTLIKNLPVHKRSLIFSYFNLVKVRELNWKENLKEKRITTWSFGNNCLWKLCEPIWKGNEWKLWGEMGEAAEHLYNGKLMKIRSLWF